MYPYKVFLGMDLYTLLMVVGVVACMIFIRLQGDKRGFRPAFQNLLIIDTVLAIVAGYGSAVLFQAYYNYRASGTFEIVSTTGATFYGGLIGGTAAFILVYFLVGFLLFPDGYHKKNFRAVADLAAACITVAHGFGRIGCLMAGCCHGAPTDAWYGIYMASAGCRVVPVQLFEALFLLALGGVLLLLMKKGYRHQMPIYMMSYSTWRFLIEYARADDRGQTVVRFLSPSQLFSVLMMLGGIAILVIEVYVDRRKKTGKGETHA